VTCTEFLLGYETTTIDAPCQAKHERSPSQVVYQSDRSMEPTEKEREIWGASRGYKAIRYVCHVGIAHSRRSVQPLLNL
jgi:hypothetical protein